MRHSTALLLTASLTLGWTLTTHAQNYDLSWHKIAGGGGTSTGGSYTVSGTIGQPDAGTLSGGPYTLTGGFWGVIAAVQTVGAPHLSIWTTNSSAVLSWSASYSGFSLQQNSNLGTANWVKVNASTYPITTSNGLNYVTVPVSGNQFFRLSNQ